MPDFKTRNIEQYPWGVEIEHKQSDTVESRPLLPGAIGTITYIPSQEGDVTLSADAGKSEALELSLSENRGRDRDNYPSSWDIDIQLNADEVRELLLTLTVWLERQEAT